MLNVMLVDDDVPMIKYLTKLISWESLGLRLAATANSGESAMQIFHETQLDLVITDIGMPQMDGLELVAQLKALKPELQVVFLTCHEEFHYARKAVQLDAVDYLIKDELTSEQLDESLRKAIQLLTEAKNQIEDIVYKQDLIKNKDLLKQTYFQQLLTTSSATEMLSYGKRLGINWGHSHFLMAIGSFHRASVYKQYRFEDMNLLLYAAGNIANELSLQSQQQVTLFSDADGQLICIYNYHPNLSLNTTTLFKDYLLSLRELIKQYLKMDVFLHYGTPFKGVEGIRANYKTMKMWQKSSFYEDNTFGAIKLLEIPLWNVNHSLEEQWDRITEAVKDATTNGITQSLCDLETFVREERMESGMFLAACSHRIRLIELEAKHKSEETFHSCLLRCKRLKESLELISCKLEELHAASMHMAIDKKPKLQQIDRYITDHLAENISMVDIADYLFLNPSYFSRYFKQETGVNFVDYYHQFKMKIACGLLKEKQYNIEMIALKLGYMERTYFSRIFKKYVGVSPKHYK
ncbi:response regulator transcription factor [Paenibacillus anseongense]|uniref:response regulator transcription factor n=1 Tax=Paenibacillus TaxID=44249 RepID=UPI002DBA316C|nr:response regulator [Paenibacillus anseongense]MEC0266084.1 response regulator [Paenibacillus anseongense]